MYRGLSSLWKTGEPGFLASRVSHHSKDGICRRQIFELVSDLHQIGIMHLDLEPRNIVRSPCGSIKIIDFSMAMFHDCPGIKGVSF